ncbi:S1 family peptidase [Actinomadura sp. NEAU-AAG7]|uniref:S1 family peptidase n=1 Tax=Actinomadura sp. NEAU-AAG7 TaxID=2839640 RepID=UPI001BE47DF0|nr:S1 family peptidase [Actinomadura sp. NEAU-AAG7]MBT2207955.1 hypothetical protein [Actinomadura sp. NEAU-AAG7]
MRLRISSAAATAAACAIATLAAPAPGAMASSASPASPAAPPSAVGGQTVYASDGSPCTLGFNVRRSDGYYFLTAGSCARQDQRVYADSAKTTALGTVVARTPLGVGLVRYVEPQAERPGGVDTHPGSQHIKGAGHVPIGQQICRSSPVSGLRCGKLKAVDLSVMLPDGTMGTIAQTDACGLPGDAPGAPYFAGGTALGVEFQGSGACEGGENSYYQQLDEILVQLGGGEVY